MSLAGSEQPCMPRMGHQVHARQDRRPATRRTSGPWCSGSPARTRMGVLAANCDRAGPIRPRPVAVRDRRTLDRDPHADSWTAPLIWNQNHLRRILRQHETHHNAHRPYRLLDVAATLKPLPEPAHLDQYRVAR